MNKGHIADAVAEKTGLSRRRAHEVVDAVLEAVITGLVGGSDVILTHFGTFQSHWVAERERRNPKNGATWIAPGHYVVRFKAHDRFRELVREGDQTAAVSVKKLPKSR